MNKELTDENLEFKTISIRNCCGFFFFPAVPTLKEENFKYAFEEWLAHFTTQEKTRPK